MTKILMALVLVFSFSGAFADSSQITPEELAGEYTFIGNMGFLHYEIELGADRSATLIQYGMDGPVLTCTGVYLLDEKHLFTAVYKCNPSGDVFTHEFSLKEVTCGDLLNGVIVDLLFKSERDAEPRPIKMELKRK